MSKAVMDELLEAAMRSAVPTVVACCFPTSAAYHDPGRLGPRETVAMLNDCSPTWSMSCLRTTASRQDIGDMIMAVFGSVLRPRMTQQCGQGRQPHDDGFARTQSAARVAGQVDPSASASVPGDVVAGSIGSPKRRIHGATA
jgi:hypothetical protein